MNEVRKLAKDSTPINNSKKKKKKLHILSMIKFESLPRSHKTIHILSNDII